MNRVALHSNLYHQREHISQIATVLIGILVLILINEFEVNTQLPLQEQPITISLISPAIEPKPVTPKPIEVEPPKPVEKLIAPKESSQAPTPVAAKAAQAESTPEKVESTQMLSSVNNTLPVMESPVPVQENTVAPALSTVNSQSSNAPKVDETKASMMSNGASEGGFAQEIKARIERKKEYPENARNLGMTGEVVLLYELDRSGNLMRVEVLSSSGHKLLDQAALKAVRSVRYAVFPDDAWVGSASKAFKTKLVFQLN